MSATYIEYVNSTLTLINQDYLVPMYNIVHILFGPILAIFIIILIIKILFRKHDLIVEAFENSSGDKDLDDKLAGFRQLAREELIYWLFFVQEIASASISESGFEESRPFEYMPVPSDMPDPTLKNLAASLEYLTPDKIKPFNHFINIIFPPKGIKVSCVLHYIKKSDKIGITVRTDDIGRRQEPRVHTIWETNEPDKRKKIMDRSIEERYQVINAPAAFWVAGEICRMRMQDKMKSPWGFLLTKDEKNKKEAQIHNFIGFLHLYFGIDYNYPCCPDMLEIFRLISEDFKNAKNSI